MYSYEFFKPGYIYACQWPVSDTIFYNLICNINSANTIEYKLLLTLPQGEYPGLGRLEVWDPFIITPNHLFSEIGHIDNHPEFLI